MWSQSHVLIASCEDLLQLCVGRETGGKLWWKTLTGLGIVEGMGGIHLSTEAKLRLLWWLLTNCLVLGKGQVPAEDVHHLGNKKGGLATVDEDGDVQKEGREMDGWVPWEAKWLMRRRQAYRAESARVCESLPGRLGCHSE